MSDTPVLVGRRLKFMFGVNNMLAAVGLWPKAESMLRLPPAKRLAMKPPAWATYPMPDSVRTRIDAIPGRQGAIPVKFFLPAQVDRSAACILFIHGGGFVAGGCGSSDYLCAGVSERTRAVVASIEYRLAPEFPFPAGFEDCVDALEWIAGHHSSLGSDRPELVVMGDSAGGNLAAALCIYARDHGGPRISRQVLIYPTLDLTLQSPSMDFEGFGLTRKEAILMCGAYLQGADPANPLVSPLAAPDLSGLPPALIQTADCDVLRDDGRRYAERLRTAGVAVQYQNYTGMPHGFYSSARICASAPQALAEVAAFLRA